MQSRRFRSLGSAVLVALLGAGASAQEARWIRYASLSPDAKQVVFSYRGDLWIAALGEGDSVQAELLTTHEGTERSPVWSPDGERIAFAADWHGQFDVFVTGVQRGAAQRLTHHSADDVPSAFSRDGQRVYFSSTRADSAAARIGTTRLPELYEVSREGGMPVQLLTTPAEEARPSADGGRFVYQDRKGYEDEWRKHHVSSVTRDIWMWDRASGAHTQLTQFRGEDRDPVWMPDGSLCWLSEMPQTADATGSSFNVWKMDPREPGEAVALTRHEGHPCRFLSAAADGTLAYTYRGELWLGSERDGFRKITVHAAADARHNPVSLETETSGATEAVLSPDGSEVVLVLRGELFATSVDHGTTRRLTHTPEQERSPTWSEDGRSVYFASERNGSWNLYRIGLAREEEGLLCRATLLEEEVVLADEHETFQPVASPRGGQLAYVHDRDSIRVLDLASGRSRELVSADLNYSYSDGDLSFSWSPDGRWLSFTYSPPGRWGGEVGVIPVEGGPIVAVTRTGYDESNPVFSADGKTLVYTSGRYGRREHSGRGSDHDVFGVSLTQAAYDRALLSPEELEIAKKAEAAAEKKAKKGEKDEGEDDEEAKDEGPKVEIEPRGLDRRTRRLTLHSAPLSGLSLSEDGENLVYLAEADGKWDLYAAHSRTRSAKRVLTLGDARPGSLELARDGKFLLLRRGDGRLAKITLSTGKTGAVESATQTAVSYRAEMTVDGPRERAHLFEHVWRQVLRKFYRPDLHGVDWFALKREYAYFLPHISNGREFAELLSEMLGELNASHTGARYRHRDPSADRTASLGLILGDLGEQGWDVEEVLAGGPCDRSDSKIAAGVRITALDGVALDPSVNAWSLLNRRDGQPMLLSLQDGAERWDEVVTPISGAAESGLLYERWVERCRRLVEERSKGRIGYVHVRGMNDASYRVVYDEVLGRYGDRDALIVDTRFNGGGWLHDQLITFLGGEEYCQLVPRGKRPGQLGGEPMDRWSKPVVVLQNEGNYSDAHFFPYAFKTLGLGPLVGAPVAGTATAVWWETLMDGVTVFGIPQVGVLDTEGQYLENQELFPDVLVLNSPESVAAGRDLQLEKCLQILQEEVGTR